MDRLIRRFRDTLRERFELVDQHVLVACSGGLDSIVLLYLFRFAMRADLRLSVAHFDHAMRADSAADAEWLRGLCAAWQLRLCTGRADPVPHSEAEARAARYQFLENTADAIGAHYIATAHHADDQVETVLFRLLRGTGTDGLAGIPARRGRVIRPLLSFGRKELEQLARARGLSWRHDPTNGLRRFARNRIRHDVLPALEASWPGVRRALLRVAREAARTRQAWARLLRGVEARVVTLRAADRVELARPILLEYHRETRARLLRRCLAQLGSRPGFSGTAAMEAFITAGGSGSGIDIKGGLRAVRDFDTIRLVRVRPALAADRSLEIISPAPGSAEALLGGALYRVDWSTGRARADLDSVAIDPAAVRFPLWIRAWQPGDRIGLPVGTKKLKKLFAERRLSRDRRGSVPVLVDTDGTVLWVAGLARAAAARPGPDAPALCIRVRNGESD